MAYIVMVYDVMAYRVMGYKGMACIAMACIGALNCSSPDEKADGSSKAPSSTAIGTPEAIDIIMADTGI